MKTIRPIFSGGMATDPRKGFTLVEVAVIIAMVALLFSLRLVAIAGAQNQNKIAQCAANLRQVTLAVQIYGGENSDKLPILSPPSAASWPWDLPWKIGDVLLSCGLQKKNFYCPGTAPRFSDLANFGDPTLDAGGYPKNLWDFGSSVKYPAGPFHIAGYVFAFSGMQCKLLASAQNTTLQSERTPNPTNLLFPRVYISASDRVLTADATICSPAGVASTPVSARYNTALYPTLTYTEVVGGFYLHHLSPHLKGPFPAGGNVGFKDGHVTWRKFDDMSQRASSGQSFWW